MGLFDFFRPSAIRDLVKTEEPATPTKIISPTGQEVMLGEASLDWKNPFGIGTLGLLTNEDELVGKHGLEVYRLMEERDAQVRFCLSLKKLACLSSPWEIHPADVSDEDTNTKAPAKKGGATKPASGQGAPPKPDEDDEDADEPDQGPTINVFH